MKSYADGSVIKKIHPISADLIIGQNNEHGANIKRSNDYLFHRFLPELDCLLISEIFNHCSNSALSQNVVFKYVLCIE